ncbi:hypothetical protein C8J56DRAFT_893086 [Mycena floridula]|nr:hypothetical protein C8J56DRAFT_893086 [Mycena floridula]
MAEPEMPPLVGSTIDPLPTDGVPKTREMANDLFAASPIELLPNEILELIFLERSSGTVSPLDDLVFLGFWPSLQALETDFFVCSPNAEQMVHRHRLLHSVEIMQEHLRRSRGFPLTFSITSETLIGPMRVSSFTQIVTVLAVIGAHSEQWRTATAQLRTRNENLTEALFNQISGHLPCLEKLEWYGLPRTMPSVVVAPRLYDLSLQGTSFTRFFSYSQLEKVGVYAMDSDQALFDLRILQAAAARSHRPVLCSDAHPAPFEREPVSSDDSAEAPAVRPKYEGGTFTQFATPSSL